MSLLLNALKKAALDKQQREAGESSDDASAEKDAKQESAEILPVENINTDESSSKFYDVEEPEAAENKPSVGANNYMAFDPELVSLDEEERSIATDEAKEPEHEETNDASQFSLEDIDPDLEFNAEEIEELPGTDQEENLIAAPEPDLTETTESTLPTEERSIELETVDEIDSKEPLLAQEKTAPIIPTEKTNLEDDSTDPHSEKTVQDIDNEAIAETFNESEIKKISQDIAEARKNERKLAMKQLIEKNESALKTGHKKRNFLMLILTLLVIFSIGAYYFYSKLESESVSLYQPNNLNSVNLNTGQQSDEGTANLTAGEASNENTGETAAEQTSLEVAKTPSTTKPKEETTPPGGEIKPLKRTNRLTPLEVKRSVATVKTPATPVKTQQAKKPIVKKQPQTIAVSEVESTQSALSRSIQVGYAAWQRGDWYTAEHAYEEALAISPHQRDAVLGAAAVAAQLGDERKALRLYQMRIERAPKDEYALAGILSLSAVNSGNTDIESELNQLLQEFPNAAHLHYVKGTIYARREQWQGAQNHFFEAWRLDYSRPDYVFNLAVAMDHLELYPQALEFYTQAYEMAKGYATNFSQTELQARIKSLQNQLQSSQ